MSQCGKIFIESGLLNIHDTVRTESRKYDCLNGEIIGDPFVSGKIIDRVIGCAEKFDIGSVDHLPRGKKSALELLVYGLPDLIGIIQSERFLDIKVAVKLEAGPVVHRITNGALDHACPGKKLLIVVGIACDEFFVDTCGTHQSPLIMITGEPEPGDILKRDIICDVLRIQMTVIVNDGTFLRIVEIKTLSR